MLLMVVIPPKVDKSKELFNEHRLLELAKRVKVQKNPRLIGLPKLREYTERPKGLKCASDHMTELWSQTGLKELKCANCGGGHPTNKVYLKGIALIKLQVTRTRLKVVTYDPLLKHKCNAAITDAAFPRKSLACYSVNTEISVDYVIDN
nr:unnamed protein product [Callosobruchus chinensis]